MADYVASFPDRRRHGASWSAIFAGTFAFLAIMATFEALGIAIFSGSVPGNNTVGITVWSTVLAIISLTVAGRATGRLSGSCDANHATYLGLVTFGMCVFSTVLSLALIAGAVGANSATGLRLMNPGSVIAAGGYGLFVALLLGMIGCIWGARAEVRPIAVAPIDRPSNLRNVA